MHVQGTLSIADVRYEIHADVPGLFRAGPDKPYLPFWNVPEESRRRVVPVRMTTGKNLPSGFTLLFDTEEAWQVHARGRERMIVHWPERDRAPVWTACFDSVEPERGVEITCDLEWIQSAAGWTNPLSYPLDHVLTMYLLAGRGLIVHGCGVVAEGRGMIFSGVSGAGKSTLARRLLSESSVRVLSDDRMVVCREGSGFRMFGSPWLGDADLGLNEGAPLRAVFLIQKGEPLAVRALSRAETVRRLLPMLAVPWYEEGVSGRILSTVEKLLDAVVMAEAVIPRPCEARRILEACGAVL